MTTEAISLGNISVTIGMPVGKPIPPQTSVSLFATAYQMGKMGLRCELGMLQCGVINIARDTVLDEFLLNGTDKLFWIDSDMAWSPDEFLKFLALSTKFDVLVASYPVKVPGPTLFHVNAEDMTFEPNEYGLMQMNGMGLGFTIIDRKVCEAIAATKPRVIDTNGRNMAEVFRIDKTAKGHRRTEDMAFFADIRDLGYAIWCDPSIELGHVGDNEWRGRLSDAMNAADTTQSRKDS